MFKQTKVFEQMKRAVFVERAGAVGAAAGPELRANREIVLAAVQECNCACQRGETAHVGTGGTLIQWRAAGLSASRCARCEFVVHVEPTLPCPAGVDGRLPGAGCRICGHGSRGARAVA